MFGQSPTQKQSELVFKAAHKIGESDAYYPEVTSVIFRLKQYIDNNEISITIDKPTIQGLAGLLKNCGCKLSAGNREDAVKKRVTGSEIPLGAQDLRTSPPVGTKKASRAEAPEPEFIDEPEEPVT